MNFGSNIKFKNVENIRLITRYQTFLSKLKLNSVFFSFLLLLNEIFMPKNTFTLTQVQTQIQRYLTFTLIIRNTEMI